MRAWIAAIVVVGMVSGCQYGPYQFTCTDDASCGADGKCEPGFNLCSFPNDARCGSGGRAFGDLGGTNSGRCVNGTPLSDAGSPPCYGNFPFAVCFKSPPTGTIDVSATTTFDTGTGTVSGTQLACATPMSGGVGACVLAAGTIQVNMPLRAIGARPLILVAADSISVSASIDVGSHRQQSTEVIGAGADPQDVCAPGTAPTKSGGGAGGSFLGRGGAGGTGDSETSGAGVAGAVSAAPAVLRGGCRGQDGQAMFAGDRGLGGHGGGAVFLIAGNRITGAGIINAGGEAGDGGQVITTGVYSGGGGGGAGGMIGLDAPSITFTGMLVANGGGGSEGSGDTLSGRAGNDATSTDAALGGGHDTIGGDGGNGSAGPANGPGMDAVAMASGGGGGGGGGAGFIKAPVTANLGPNVSPAPTP